MFSRIESIIRAITVIGVSISFRVTNTKKGMAVNKKILIVAFTTLMSEPSMAQSKFEGFLDKLLRAMKVTSLVVQVSLVLSLV